MKTAALDRPEVERIKSESPRVGTVCRIPSVRMMKLYQCAVFPSRRLGSTRFFRETILRSVSGFDMSKQVK
jgi:hypothetical protein